MKKQITLKYFSKVHHCSQVVTGYYLFARHSEQYTLVLEDHQSDDAYPYKGPFIEVNINGIVIIYDMLDGYQSKDEMTWFYNHCDYYFKRSFSEEYNNSIGFSSKKTYPYGFNYFVTYKGNPLDGARWKDIVKGLLGRNHNTIFTPQAFEEIPEKKNSFKILFSVRLWPVDPNLSSELNEERNRINQMRIDLVRKLRIKYADSFIGGLYDTPLAQKLAPDLIIPKEFTIKKNYLKRLHECDICIGTMGLHESIGGKTGEYIAAAKAIVQENMHYKVTGDFIDGKNYFSFTTTEECLNAVELLMSSPDIVYNMKLANSEYYKQYLKPDMLVLNTLNIISQ